MQQFITPRKQDWPSLLERPPHNTVHLFNEVEAILEDIREGGDASVIKYSGLFDGYTGTNLQVEPSAIASAGALLTGDLKSAIKVAASNIEKFHASQRQPVIKVETQPGVTCWQKSIGIERVGLYVPGGTAPLFSTALMLGIPARLAGCHEIVLCTPPNKNGEINPAILYAASLAGITRIFKIGGVQAIGAMAFGTETVPRVYKIFGPGNHYVTAAKQLISIRGTAIDMPAGPSELLVMADDSANPAFVAADLLSQAEHGAGSQVILLTNCRSLLKETNIELEKQLNNLPRAAHATTALTLSRAIVLESIDEMIEMSNLYAPEHLILALRNAGQVAELVTNAGSVFIGHYTPESAGDYASGTNHTLPTNGHARAYSGVNLDSFTRKLTFQEVTRKGLETLGPVVETLATSEHLQAHANAITVRLKSS